ncbi:25-hydroxyvitamin D-1 alpha hydroxylase [Beauveria bassiana D1-5]|uniref:25-hydroxyvitamin D-1 alpha hydroxylase n=1 Tax=Beauveria bassiana D1-5 TaxID=1245745 RepID=A0A0A2VE91_BEABA|nr:25-hydroxyvitamin D-1 alpha hydroxylase [Beauveria bassiana D1-5]
MRAHFEPEFSHLASLNMTNTFEMEIEGWADMLSKSHALREKEVTLGSFQRDPTEACRYLPFRLTGLTVYGEALDDETYQDLVHLNDLHEEVMLDAFFGKLTVSNIYNILPTQSKRRLDTFKSKWEKLNLDIVAKARTKNFHCPAERIYKGVESGKMSKVEFLETMDELLFTNIDVTSTVLAFLLINIAANQTFQSLLRDEIAAKQSQPSYNLSDYVLEKNSLLHYAAMESVRMSPALWFSLPEKTAAKKVIGGYLIPAKTPVFRPERFADISPTAYRYGLLRFGMGRGRCLGKNIADMMLKMAAVAIVQRFSMVPAGKEKGTRQDRFTVTSEQEIEFTPLSQMK